jgi:hypothetical protein
MVCTVQASTLEMDLGLLLQITFVQVFVYMLQRVSHWRRHLGFGVVLQSV